MRGMIMAAALLVVLGAAAAKAADNADVTPGELMSACDSSSEVDRDNCTSYFVGAVNMLKATMQAYDVQPGFCIDRAKWSPDMSRMAFERWAKSHPDKLATSSGVVALILSMRDSYPCK